MKHSVDDNMGISDNDKQMKRQRRRMEHEDEDYGTKAKSEGNIKVWEHTLPLNVSLSESPYQHRFDIFRKIDWSFEYSWTSKNLRAFKTKKQKQKHSSRRPRCGAAKRERSRNLEHRAARSKRGASAVVDFGYFFPLFLYNTDVH